MNTTVGDSLKRISSRIYNDIKKLFLILADQDPELRTSEMRIFISRTKKVLYQMLAILKWLQSSGVMRIFECLSDFDSRITYIENGLNRNMDEMYFLHASVFSMRSRELQVSEAFRLLATGGASSLLPSSIFSCGLKPLPEKFVVSNSLVNTGEDEDSNFRSAMIDELNLMIRAKIVLNDVVPVSSFHNSISLSVAKGILYVKYKNYFDLDLTLQYLDIQSEWKILNFSLHDSIKRTSTASYEFSSLESEVVQILREKVAAIQIQKKVEEVPSEDSMVVVLSDEDQSTAVMKKEFNLMSMIPICRHVAIGASLRILYIQSLAHISHVGNAYVQASYSEGDEVALSVLKIDFWLKQPGGEYWFSMKISQPSQATLHGEGLLLSLDTWDTSRPVDTSGLTIVPKLPVSYFGDILSGEHFIAQGVDFVGLFMECVELCAQCKLLLLCARLLQFSKTAMPTFMERFKLSFSDSGIILQRKESGASSSGSAGNVFVSISADCRTGKLMIETFGLKDILDTSRRAIDLFVAEINNIDSEVFFHVFIAKYGLQRLWKVLTLVKSLKELTIDTCAELLEVSSPVSSLLVTFEALCWLLELAWWFNVIKIDFGAENNPSLCKLLQSNTISDPLVMVVIRSYEQYIASDAKYNALTKALYPACHLIAETSKLQSYNSTLENAYGNNRKRKFEESSSDSVLASENKELLLCLSIRIGKDFKISSHMHLCSRNATEQARKSKFEYTIHHSAVCESTESEISTELFTRAVVENRLHQLSAISFTWSTKYISVPIPSRALTNSTSDPDEQLFMKHSELGISLLNENRDDIDVVLGSLKVAVKLKGSEFGQVVIGIWNPKNESKFDENVAVKLTLLRKSGDCDGGFQVKCKSVQFLNAADNESKVFVSWEVFLFLCVQKMVASLAVSSSEEIRAAVVSTVLRLRPLALFAYHAAMYPTTTDVLEAITWSTTLGGLPCITFSFSTAFPTDSQHDDSSDTRVLEDSKELLRGYYQVATSDSIDGNQFVIKDLQSGAVKLFEASQVERGIPLFGAVSYLRTHLSTKIQQ